MNKYLILLALVLLFSSASVYSKCYIATESFHPVNGYGYHGYPDQDYIGTDYDIQVTDTTENVGFGTTRTRQIRRLPSYNPYYYYDWQTMQNTASTSVQDLLNKINPNLVVLGLFFVMVALITRAKNKE
jgi:hypothetical protein